MFVFPLVFDMFWKCTEWGGVGGGVGAGGCSTDWGTGLVSNRIVRHSRSRPLSDVRPRPTMIGQYCGNLGVRFNNLHIYLL